MHRILVIADHHSINPQARTYAEYRVFAAVARHIRGVRRVRVVLRSAQEKRARKDKVACAITVGLEPSGSLRIRATGPHVYAAINSAVEQLVRAMEQRAAQLESSPSDDRLRFETRLRSQTG
jgi:ribosome-associated translation inhibitor RaiA